MTLREDIPLDRRRPKFYLAPMVRYSKLAFRKLVRLYDVDCCYTPMIYAKNFLESEHCRTSEFSTVPDDRPLIVQFASDDPFVFGSAAELVYNYATGVDLNCGCPKSDVRAKGFGSFLLNRPDLLADIVKQCRARISDPDFTISLKIRVQYPLEGTVDLCRKISLKIRVQYPLERTVDLCRKAEKAGVSHLTVHGRTPQMRSEPVDYDAIRIVKESVAVPVIANGDITQRSQALDIAEKTGVDGVMAANGLLYNPALFAGHEYTPASCIRDFLNLSADHGLPLHLFQQHLIYMLRDLTTPYQRRVLHELSSRPAIEQFLENVLLMNDIEYSVLTMSF
ncbi:dihydrouridine synthase [Oesophagostomum dentatum]|uniref:tRNA-dihydrouridine synthase n=1 Tax=Oesophagostomum dentatum TaxID=61180 RepID=A0A0B1TS11_OESDE|nr:dihydrouridine synthase [Oesophagostomum dentatum]